MARGTMSQQRAPNLSNFQQWMLYQQLLSSQGFANPLLNTTPAPLMRSGSAGGIPLTPNVNVLGPGGIGVLSPGGVFPSPRFLDVRPLESLSIQSDLSVNFRKDAIDGDLDLPVSFSSMVPSLLPTEMRNLPAGIVTTAIGGSDN